MRRLFVAAALLCLVGAAYFSGFYYVKNVCDRADELLDTCVEAYSEEKITKKQAEELEKYWGKKENIMSVFANHARIDEIELAIHSVVVHSNSEDATIFYENSGRVKTLLHQLLEDTHPSAHSIL